MAATSAIWPVADCANENATSQVSSVTESASASSGTDRTRMPLRCRNGNTTELKSPSTQSTSAPSGTAAATTLTSTEVCDPVATRSTGTPTSAA